ncbi:hypothetical protein CA13_11070 [Planctomycetes bacterium CA13]|uniref:Uncharacterized protein n=1 Tax=Novipirellula herctigrandis TaxID=2527986 RepID=A0A5C5YXT6_9BACT|nr:hypothetical protein CA13_11070 [Planctomycetes bacterium CA13]
MTSVTINGIHDVAAPDPCHIVDLTIRDATVDCERLKGIVYDAVVDHRATQQAPFGEHYLSLDDGSVIGDYRYGWDHPEIWIADIRVAFLMHFLEPGRNIKTPYGLVAIPEATVMPRRLAGLKYESPY